MLPVSLRPLIEAAKAYNAACMFRGAANTTEELHERYPAVLAAQERLQAVVIEVPVFMALAYLEADTDG